MVHAPSAALIDTLRLPTSTSFQLNSLRQVKNSIIGHDQKKEAAVRHGLVEPLAQIVATAAKAAGKRSLNASNDHDERPRSLSWSEEDEARLQATIVIECLAAGGRQFVPPLLAAEIDKHLLTGLSPDNPPKLVSASLQALRNLALSWSASSGVDELDASVNLSLFTPDSVDLFSRILRQPASVASHKQIVLTCGIITSAALDDNVKSLLTTSSILDTLTALLVSHSIANKHLEYHGERGHLPPAPPANALPDILSAIATIISDSSYRTQRFIHSQPVRDLCLQFFSGDEGTRQMLDPKYGLPNAGGTLLPPLHIPSHKTVSFNASSSPFPPLSGLDPRNKPFVTAYATKPPVFDADHSNMVISWLLYFVRSLNGIDRLVALRLLSLVEAAVHTAVNPASTPLSSQRSSDRERQSALLAVPLAVQLVSENLDNRSDDDPLNQAESRIIKEDACGVLALLIKRSEQLQSAAVSAGAIKYICPVLRKSFDNVALSKPMWSAHPVQDRVEDSPSCRLGPRGLSAEALHALKCRLGALEALGALAEEEDIHRKAIVDSGVVSCIIDSLKPLPQDITTKIDASRGGLGPKAGNTTAVILAACNTAKMMSRSVSLLRTSLIDAGIAKPMFELLQHQSVDVQIAATDVCANLLLEFSPMREDLIASGVVKILCNHARRSVPALRLSSLWALKHLMLGSPKELKVSTLEELGTGWLVSAIAGERREANNGHHNGGVSVALSSANAAGEQVDLLNPSTMDVDSPPTPEGQENSAAEDGFEDDDDGELMYDEASNTHYHASSIRSTLHPPPPQFDTKKYLPSVSEREQNPALQAKRDDVAIQEQALDFLRNLLNGDDCALMLEHIFRELGHQKIFDLLNTKLSPLQQRHTSGTSASNTSPTSRPLYNPSELILSAIHVVAHIANGSPKHKQLLIAQRPLLQAWLPHFTHPNPRVRTICVWTVISLTWIEEERDRADARQRSQELRSLGIEGAIRALANDFDLDVRERVKTATRQLDGL